DAAGERRHAGIAELTVVVDLDHVRRVERLVLEPRDGREQLPLALRRAVVELPPPLLGGVSKLRAALGRRHAGSVGRRRSGGLEIPRRVGRPTPFGGFSGSRLPGRAAMPIHQRWRTYA